jgi:hypothetical protein
MMPGADLGLPLLESASGKNIITDLELGELVHDYPA